MGVDEHASRLIGLVAFDDAGIKLGRVNQIFLDRESGAPRWVAINMGFFGMTEVIAPVEGARVDGEELYLAVAKDVLKETAAVDAVEGVTPAIESELAEVYGQEDSA